MSDTAMLDAFAEQFEHLARAVEVYTRRRVSGPARDRWDGRAEALLSGRLAALGGVIERCCGLPEDAIMDRLEQRIRVT